MIRFACPGCSATYTVGDDRAGKVTRCPKCQTKFVIPEPEPAAAASPPPPPAAGPPLLPAADEPVEIAPCPSCQTRLSVMPVDLGLDVECPTCQTVFKAVKPGAAPPAPPPAPPRRSVLEATDDTGAPVSRRRDEYDEDRPRRRRRDEYDEDDRPSRRGRRRDEDDEEDEDRPRRRRDEDEEDEDRPRRRRRRRGYEPHRGGTILALGLFGCLCCGIAAFAAAIMGMQDLSKMNNGQMDPDGKTTTIIGVVFGVLGVIVWILNIVLKVTGNI